MPCMVGGKRWLPAILLAFAAATAGCEVHDAGSPAASGPAPSGVGASSAGALRTAGCRADRHAPKRRLRGMWVSTFRNIDWPSRPGLSPRKQRKQFIGLLDAARAAGLNAVFVQVRPRADAIYKSRYEPWSQALTGTPGVSPGYDPLAFMVRAAHRRGLRLHAWFNPFQITTEGDKPLPNGDPARKHPGWVRRYDGRLYYDPGVPAVRAFVRKVVMDVVNHYDIDGVHFDDHFYPYPVAGKTFHDKATFKRYGHGFAHRDDWRRHNVDVFVRDVHAAVHRAKPWVSMGVSPFGIWRNASSSPHGSHTSGLQSYDSVYADTRAWIRHHWVDYVAPQLYWSDREKAARYDVLVRWWAHQAKGSGVRLYIGHAAYRVGTGSDDKAFRGGGIMAAQVTQDARYPQITGDIYFSARDFVTDKLHFVQKLDAGPYAHPALPPITGHGAAPVPVGDLTAKRTAHGTTLGWAGARSVREYAIYGFDSPPRRCDFADAAHLLTTAGAGSGHHTITLPAERHAKYLAVTAIGRTGMESTPATTAITTH